MSETNSANVASNGKDPVMQKLNEIAEGIDAINDQLLELNERIQELGNGDTFVEFES